MIALITPTGMRHTQIKLCERWMKAQTYQGSVLWVLVDDGEVNSIESITANANFELIKLYPDNKWSAGQNTQASNLEMAMNYLQSRSDEISFVCVIEDDDYYSPMYLEKMNALMCNRLYYAAGEIPTVYYNVRTRCKIVNKNINHSSLFQTAFQWSVAKLFMYVLQKRPKFIDMVFWEKLRQISRQRILLERFDKPLSVGIKGMNGRPGIGYGHLHFSGTSKNDFSELRQLIGDDYKYYENVCQ